MRFDVTQLGDHWVRLVEWDPDVRSYEQGVAVGRKAESVRCEKLLNSRKLCTRPKGHSGICYHRDSPEHRAYMAEYQAKRQSRRRQYWGVILDWWKMEKGCAVCGFQSKRALFFDMDHIDRATKVANLASLTNSLDPNSPEHHYTFASELFKCQVLCVACHREKTREENRGAWYTEVQPTEEDKMSLKDIPSELEGFVDKLVAHTRTAVSKALAAAEAKFSQEKAVIAADVRKATTDALATLKADAPEIEAALKTGAKAIVDAVEAALQSHTL